MLEHCHMGKTEVVEAGSVESLDEAALDLPRWNAEQRTNEHRICGVAKFGG
jgi:hypothetical protein